MMKEEKLIGKALYKISLYLLEKIPMVTAVLYLADTILSYFTDKTNPIVSAICGMSILPIIFFYVTSITFGFCKWHRMFIHYIVVNEVLSWYDPDGAEGLMFNRWIADMKWLGEPIDWSEFI